MNTVWTVYFSAAILLFILMAAVGLFIRPTRPKWTWREFFRAFVITNVVLFALEGTAFLIWWFS